MALKPSSLSFASESIRAFLAAQIDDVPTNVEVVTGSPGGDQIPTDKNAINLFFYRFEPAGFGPIARPDEPWRIRVHCLISAFGILFDNVASGENELRMLGEVIRLFHENPILESTEFEPEGDAPGESFRIEAIFNPMTEQSLGQFWSAHTSSDGRALPPSVAYEFSLVPIVPETRRVDPPIVGALGAESRADLSRRHDAPTVIPMGPTLTRQTIDTANPLWAPQLCWIVSEACHLTQALAKADATGASAQVWIAGDPGDTVELVWESWRTDSGWTRTHAPAATVSPATNFIDPDTIPPTVPGTFPADIALPGVFSDVDSAQLMLYAQRTVTPTSGDALTLRSNPLLISIFTP